MIPLPECCTTCVSCGLPWCRDETPSPGEVEGLCPDCWELEDVS
jgi:hypothetical protein